MIDMTLPGCRASQAVGQASDRRNGGCIDVGRVPRLVCLFALGGTKHARLSVRHQIKSDPRTLFGWRAPTHPGPGFGGADLPL